MSYLSAPLKLCLLLLPFLGLCVGFEPASAQEKLGYLYEHGVGLSADPFAAADYYLRAAEQGMVTAQNNLGRLYQLGAGVKQDNQQAAYWYEKAAAQGSEAARANLEKLNTP